MRCLPDILGALALLTTAAGATAQAPAWLEAIAPGFDSVARDPVEYRRVLDKFSAAQYRLSIRDCAIAYYGFSMQPGFDATSTASAEDDMQRALEAEDYATAYTLGTQILGHTPVNLSTLYWTLYAATEIHESWEVRNSLKGRYNSISFVISLSGDGTSPHTPMQVVWESDMYTYTMIELELEIGEGYLWDGHLTEFEVSPTGPAPKFKHTSIFFEKWTAVGTPTAAGTPAAD